MNLRMVSKGGSDSLRAKEDSEETKVQDCGRRGGHLESGRKV